MSCPCLRQLLLSVPLVLGLGGDGQLVGGLALCHGIRVRAPAARCQRAEASQRAWRAIGCPRRRQFRGEPLRGLELGSQQGHLEAVPRQVWVLVQGARRAGRLAVGRRGGRPAVAVPAKTYPARGPGMGDSAGQRLNVSAARGPTHQGRKPAPPPDKETINARLRVFVCDCCATAQVCPGAVRIPTAATSNARRLGRDAPPRTGSMNGVSTGR